MTTTVKITCNGPNYRSVVVAERDRNNPSYVYSGLDGQPNPEASFGVGQSSHLLVTEEYSATGWNRETNQPNPAPDTALRRPKAAWPGGGQ